ncbi:MAG: glycosyltransferase family 2 protein [Patescibacteria group bacterium]
MNGDKIPFVSVIVPCRNEERFIAECLESIISNDYPKERLEVLVMDGMSKDKTKEIIENVKSKNSGSGIRLIENPKIITPAAMNLGIKESNGEIIIKMDAHAVYAKDYISKCVKHLLESGADNVGGVLKTIPAKDTLVSKAIAISLSHPFGAGASYFRIGSDKPRWVDTVAFGCYQKKTLEKLGGFDEKMAKIEDYELNSRLRKAGGKILLAPDIIAYYYPSSDNLGSFFEHNFTDGIWSTYSFKFGFFSLSVRHLIPLFFVLSLLLTLILGIFFWVVRLTFDLIFLVYFIVNLYFSFRIAIQKGIKYFFVMPIVFTSRHIGYGLGSLWGIIKIILKI